MSLHQSDKDDLWELLLGLLEDDESSIDDVIVIQGGAFPPETFNSCCTYNYAGYG